MESGINLLPEITEKEIKAGVYQKKVNIFALGALGAVGLIILGLIAYRVFLAVNAQTVENRSKTATDNITKYISDVEIPNDTLKEKLDKIQNLLTNEVPTSSVIDQLTAAAQTSQPVTISGLSAQSDGTILVDGTVTNSDTFREWVNNLTNTNGQDYFSKINVVSLTGDSSGYKFSLAMNFLKKGVYQPNSK